jgi:hypothetical protein
VVVVVVVVVAVAVVRQGGWYPFVRDREEGGNGQTGLITAAVKLMIVRVAHSHALAKFQNKFGLFKLTTRLVLST